MAFVKKTWKDRIVQYANRRLLTKSGGEVEQVTVTRDEGTVSVAGDKFDAATMNDLENRIKQSIDNIDSLISEKVTDLNTPLTTGTATPKISYYASTASNKPSGNDGVTITQGNGTYRQQMAFDLEGNTFARYYNNGTISSWKRIAGSSENVKSQITFNEDISATNTNVWRKDGCLYIYYQGQYLTHNAGDIIFTLPTAIRPQFTSYYPCVINEQAYGDVEINNLGVCKLNQVSLANAPGRVYFHCVIPLW